MKAWETLGEAPAPDGGTLLLQRRGDEYALRVRGQVLMTSRARDSERALAAAATDDARARKLSAPRVLVGGLGLGFTLRALLDKAPPAARVTVAELSPAVVGWHRTVLRALTGDALADPRVDVTVGDVGALLARSPASAFDAVLLDVDNGPTALSARENRGLYAPVGLRAAHAALAPGGVYVLWSAGVDAAFLRRMTAAGFRDARARSCGGRYVLFEGRA